MKPTWRNLMDPRDPDYEELLDMVDEEDFDEDEQDADDPADYEGTARYHGGAL